jgi:cysteinyl-tRNA synthetase
MLKVFNTLGRKEEEFTTYKEGKVGMYACGPTVYDYAHIGHGRKYVGDDIIKRALRYLGYEVTHVMNITDVGHLVSDGDEGEDKLEKGAAKQGKTVWEVAEFFTQDFLQEMDKLNVERAEVLPRATDHVPEQIAMIEKLFANGYAYDTPEAVYFDVAKFPDYSKLFGQDISEKEVGVRDEVKVDSNKHNPADFVLWFKRVGKYEHHMMHWDSPWGDGFPGWHIECSAMSTKYLGDQFEIHTGGEDHVSIHHPNEIAQSEAATGHKPFVKYWVHHAFLKVDNQKMSKSLNNFYRVTDVVEKGYDPLALRYLYLTAHYRKPINFTWESLEGAQTALNKLRAKLEEWQRSLRAETPLAPAADSTFRQKFVETLEADFNTPEALAVVWELTKSELDNEVKLKTLLEFDQVLGLQLESWLSNPHRGTVAEVPAEAKALLEQRLQARADKNWAESDRLRDELQEKFGLTVKDTADGQEIIT